MKSSHVLTTTSLALLAAFSAIACGGSEVEPADQSQRAGLTQGAEAPAGDATAPEAHAEHRRGPRGERGFGPPSPDKLIERFDADKDGALQAAELPERMQQRIGDIDKSGDGVVSKEELTVHFKAMKGEHVKRFAERAKERFEQRDANKDGFLDSPEVGERWSKLSVADANGDQKLTQDELKAAFEAGKLKPMRGEHRRHPGSREGEAPADAPTAPPPAL